MRNTDPAAEAKETPSTTHDPGVEPEKRTVPLDRREKRQVDDRVSLPARLVHEIVPRQGIEELERPALSLM